MIRNGTRCNSNDDMVLTVQQCKATLTGLGKSLRNFLKNQLVMGYFRPYSHYNKGKQSEFNERKWFVEPHSCPCTRESEVLAA